MPSSISRRWGSGKAQAITGSSWNPADAMRATRSTSSNAAGRTSLTGEGYRLPSVQDRRIGTFGAVPAHRASFWPTTIEGRLGVGIFAVGLILMALVNVIQVPFLSWAVLVASLVLTGVARIVKHDEAPSVLIVLAVTVLAALAGLLFLGGEVFIGHD